jgi:hypothetical protein
VASGWWKSASRISYPKRAGTPTIFNAKIKKEKAGELHGRTIALLELQNKLGAEENEREAALAEARLAGDIRRSSYRHDAPGGSTWVVDMLRMVRPVLTLL